jgi:hypothetical protein
MRCKPEPETSVWLCPVDHSTSVNDVYFHASGSTAETHCSFSCFDIAGLKFHNMTTASEASAEVKPYQEMSGSEAAIKAIYKRRACALQIYQ